MCVTAGERGDVACYVMSYHAMLLLTLLCRCLTNDISGFYLYSILPIQFFLSLNICSLLAAVVRPVGLFHNAESASARRAIMLSLA